MEEALAAEREVARRLREREERLRAALSASGTGTFRWELRSNCLDWDENLDRLFGLAPGQTARSLEQFIALVHPDDRAELVRRCRRSAEDGVDFDMDFRVIWPDGTVHWLTDRGKTYFDEAGKPLYMTGACVDNTARKRAEQQAVESRQRLQTLFDSSQDAILLADDDGRYVDANPAACAMTGRTRDQLLSSTVFDVTPGPGRESGQALWRTFLAAGKQAGEYTLCRPDGACVAVEFRAVANIQPGVHLSVLRDISDRRQAEEERQRFVSLAESSTDFIGMCTPDRKVLFVNAAGREMVGLTEAEAMKTDPLDYFWPDDRERIVSKAIPALQRDGRWSGECRFRHFGTGEPIDTVWNAFVIRDPLSQTPVAWATISPDLRKVKAAGAALRESEEQFRQLADALPQIVWTARADGAIDYCNARWGQFSGLSDQDTLGWGWTSRVHPEDRASIIHVWRAALAGGHTMTGEYRFRRVDGEYRWQLSRALPVRDKAGAIVKWFGTLTDIDDHKRSEQALAEARDVAEHANLAKDRFLAVLSHELRTPLSPVVMAVAAMEGDEALPDQFRDDVAMIRRNIELETKLIDDLLDLSRVASGKLSLNLQPVGVHEILRSVLQICAADMDCKKLVVRPQLEAKSDVALADPARLQQVFWNLLRNATKFTPEGGTITVRTSNDATDQLRVDVVDTGIGISPDVLPRIFDAFEQGDAGITRQFGGLGLGLAIAKAVVGMHGGTIDVTSDGPGRGTTFTVRLNTAVHGAAPGRGQDPPPVADVGSFKPRLLLVDDHPDTANTLARLLKSSGYRVRTANTVAQALHLASCETFDLVVSDIGLPDGTGYDLMQQVRGLYGLSGIALSGYGMEEDMRRSRAVGFIEHVVKPVDMNHLEQVISRAIRTGNPG